MLRVAELAREWGAPACIAQLDLKKAFDHVSHVAAFQAMDEQHVPQAAQALIAKLWDLTKVVGKLGRERSDPVRLDRGVPQGAPESPNIFTMVVDMVLRRVMRRWRATGAGWKLDDVWISCVCYADDIVLIANCPRALARMCNDLIQEFNSIGLGVGADKTHWTSTPARPGESINIDGHDVTWEETLTYVDTEIDFTGSAGPAMTHRMSAGIRKLEQWRAILLAPWISLRRRAELTVTVIWASVLWCAQIWNTTKAQRQALDSWAARIMSRVKRLRQRDDEDASQWWRRRHREGHEFIRQTGQPVSALCRRLVHRWAGHVARMASDNWLASLVRCRSLQWWRWRQARHTCKWSGVHPKRFKASRWESQLADAHGDGCAEFVTDNTGWLLKAQCRGEWRNLAPQ